MIKNLKQYVVGEALRYIFDGLEQYTSPACFGDPVAMLTQWTKLSRSAANFQTHTLVSISHHQMKLASTGINCFFSSIFFVFGIYVLTRLNYGTHFYLPLTVLAGIVFICVGIVLYYFNFKPIVFDRQKGFFWKGWTHPDNIAGCKRIKCCVELDKIHALQIIRKEVKSRNNNGRTRRYFSYELNLVLKNSMRINVISHGDKHKLQEDAAKLAKFLGKPLWDASEKKIIDKNEFENIRTYVEKNPALLNDDMIKIFERLKKQFYARS